jgi:hypothetical protein
VSGPVVTRGKRRKGELDGSVIAHDGEIADCSGVWSVDAFVVRRLVLWAVRRAA